LNSSSTFFLPSLVKLPSDEDNYSSSFESDVASSLCDDEEDEILSSQSAASL
jgi:hypothetical protein